MPATACQHNAKTCTHAATKTSAHLEARRVRRAAPAAAAAAAAAALPFINQDCLYHEELGDKGDDRGGAGDNVEVGVGDQRQLLGRDPGEEREVDREQRQDRKGPEDLGELRGGGGACKVGVVREGFDSAFARASTAPVPNAEGRVGRHQLRYPQSACLPCLNMIKHGERQHTAMHGIAYVSTHNATHPRQQLQDDVLRAAAERVKQVAPRPQPLWTVERDAQSVRERYGDQAYGAGFLRKGRRDNGKQKSLDSRHFRYRIVTRHTAEGILMLYAHFGASLSCTQPRDAETACKRARERRVWGLWANSTMS